MTRLAAILLLGTLAGCAYKPPSLKVAEARITDRSDQGFVVLIGVDAENRNEVEIPLRQIRYSVTLPDGRSFSGIRSPEATLRRLGTQRITFPAVFPNTEGSVDAAGPTTCEVSGNLGFYSPGEVAQVLFDTGVRRPSVSFRGAVPVAPMTP